MEHDTTNGEWVFTFIWKIENFSHCLQKKGEILYSPLFTVKALDNSDWSLCIFPRGRHSGGEEIFGLHLRREKAGPFSVLAEYEVSIFTTDGSQPIVEYAMSLPFLKDFSGPFHGLPKQNESSIANENTFLEQEILTIRCRLRKFDPELSALEPLLLESAMQCLAVSRIGIDRGSHSWSVHEFCRLGLEDIKTTRLLTSSGLRECFTLQASLQGVTKQDSSLYLRILQHDVKYRRLLLFLKVSLLDKFGRNFKVVEDKHWFETSRKQMWMFACLITRRELLAGKNDYLPGDVLSLHCEFSISAGIEYEKIDKPCALSTVVTEKPNKVRTTQTPLATLQDDLKSLYKDQTMTDFELRTDTASFPVHKIILSARSPVFKAMFDSNMMESSTNFLHIPDLDAETLERILMFIYTSTIGAISWDSAAKLYYAADKYQILSLKQKCSTFLKRQIRVPNVCEALVIADRHQDGDLKTDVLSFLLRYMTKIIHSEEWKTFMEEHTQLAAETMHILLLTKDVVDKKPSRTSI